MRLHTLFLATLWVQGTYTLLTAIWALVNIRSFMRVTGPKTDVWLVKTVSVLLLAIGICLISYTYSGADPRPVMILGLLFSGGLAFIDFYYTANRTIRWVYAVDGVLEVIFFGIWAFLLLNYTGTA